jgi:transcriptional regulator of acetoin/glycerol metabolism
MPVFTDIQTARAADSGVNGFRLHQAAVYFECQTHVTRRILTQIEALERDAIVRSLEENGGSKLNAAAALGISRATIYRKIKDYGIA